MFLCVCKAVRVSDAVAVAKRGYDSHDSFKEVFGLEDDDCCGRCASNMEAFVARVKLELFNAEATPPAVAVRSGP